MVRGLIALVLLGTVSVGLVQTAKLETKADLAGVYSCEGTNPDGTTYHGIVEIVAVEDTFLIRWTLADGSAVVGVGVFSGGVLAASYFGGAPAVAVYRLDDDRLVGEWTMGTNGAVYSETLKRTNAAPRRPPVRGTSIDHGRVAEL